MFKKSLFSIFCAYLMILSLCIVPTASDKILSLGMEHIANDISVIKTCTANEEIRFTKADFTSAVGMDDFSQITIISLPDINSGRLKFGNMDAFSGQIISSNGIEYLRFEPSDTKEACSFKFSIDGQKEIKCMMYVISSDNSAPVGESFKVNTICDIPVFSSLRGNDSDNDEVKYTIVSQPQNGLLQIKDASTGDFKYTPHSSFIGTDSFTYRVTDKYGNTSDISTVTVKTSKNRLNTVYADMKNEPAAYAAVKLAENGILVGEKIADNMYFSPNENVTRSNFLIMAMKCAQYSPNVYTQTHTGFDDDGEISSLTKGYIVTAIKLGINCKDSKKDGNCFSPDEYISEKDACRVVGTLLGISENADMASMLISDGVIQTGSFGQEDKKLSKANCALLLNYIQEEKNNH